jgi:PEP-CTERM motif
MSFLKILRADPRRVLLIATGVIGLLSVSALVHLGLAPWAWARSNQTPENAQSTAQSEDTFQTLSEFINRSPGERGAVSRLKGVITSEFADRKDGQSPTAPSQRALGKIFEPEPFTIVSAQQIPLDLLTTPIEEIGTLATRVPFGPAIGSSSGNSAGENVIPGSLIVAPPTSSGGGGGGNETPSRPPVAAVPEPSTWTLILVGFFGTGFGLRRRHPKSQQHDRLLTS